MASVSQGGALAAAQGRERQSLQRAAWQPETSEPCFLPRTPRTA